MSHGLQKTRPARGGPRAGVCASARLLRQRGVYHTRPDPYSNARTLVREIKAGRLRTFKVGARRLISIDALRDWIRDREAETQE